MGRVVACRVGGKVACGEGGDVRREEIGGGEARGGEGRCMEGMKMMSLPGTSTILRMNIKFTHDN